ncbi:MAG: hypothetical protein QOD03_95 [Verrucomicrobiota bacterium]
MKTKIVLASLMCCVSGLAAPLSESTFTEIVKEVTVVPQATKTAQPAQINEVIKAPDLVRTGPQSRAELTAPDQTITRIGANTVFSFEPASRSMELQKGNVLFHSPKGKGGGTIKSGGASAAVLGTTIIVVATPGGGFKLIVLEGKGEVTLPNGKSVTLKAGQLVFILAGQTEFGPVLDINLAKLVGGSQLINGFSNPLSSLPLIQDAINQQNNLIQNGKAEDTGATPDAFLHGQKPQHGIPENGLNSIDDNTYQIFVVPTLPQSQG